MSGKWIMKCAHFTILKILPNHTLGANIATTENQ